MKALRTAVPFVLVVASFVVACSGAATQFSPLENGSNPCCVGGSLYRCASGQAAEQCVASGDPVDCTKTASTCNGNASSSGGASSSTGGPVVSGDGGPAKKSTGDDCTTPSECEGNRCVGSGTDTTGLCSENCNVVGDCPSGWRCVASDGNKVCFPAGNGDVGDMCSHSLDCASAICIGVEGSTGQCTKNCNTDPDCPTAWVCANVTGITGKVCVQP